MLDISQMLVDPPQELLESRELLAKSDPKCVYSVSKRDLFLLSEIILLVLFQMVWILAALTTAKGSMSAQLTRKMLGHMSLKSSLED